MSVPDPTTREQLLDAAEELFAERGFDAVSVREITSLVGANVAAVSYHFGSKHDLYLAAVRRAMESRRADEVWSMLSDPPASPLAAARTLTAFLRALLSRMLAGPEPNRCSRLMLQEATRPSDALGLVRAEFVAPHEALLEGCVRAIAPRLDEEGTRLAARSILAQPLHYLVFRAFVESGGTELSTPAAVREVAEHIARFSLRGLGLRESEIGRALDVPGEEAARTRNPSGEETSGAEIAANEDVR